MAVDDINIAIFTGRLTKDAELKYTQGGTAVCNFSIAVNRSVKKGDSWSSETDFYNLVMMGKSAEAIHKYLVKGLSVTVHGSHRMNKWEQDGEKKSRLEIFVERLSMHPKGSSQGNSEQESQHDSPVSNEGYDDDIPF